MASLETLWRAASSAQFKTTRAHWQQMLGDSFRIVEHLLLASDELGSHIPKAGCKWTWYRIVEDDSSTVFTMDDETGQIFRFPRRDAAVMRINWRLVYKSLCQSLGIELNDRGAYHIDHLRQLGSIRVVAGVELPVYHSTKCPDEPITKLIAMVNRPFVILHSSRNGVAGTSQLLLRLAGAVELSLLDFTELDSTGKVVFSAAGHNKFDQLRLQHTPVHSPVVPLSTLCPPPDARWSNVHIKFLNGDNIRVSIAGQSADYHYSRLGMANVRNAEPTKQWLLLRAFAANNGIIDWKSSGAAANVKKQTQELNQKLSVSFAIDGVPIEYDKSLSGYRTMFQIEDY